MIRDTKKVNLKYLVIPFVIGILPAVIYFSFYLITEIFGNSIPESCVAAITVYLIFIMIYAYPPALIVHPFGLEILSYQSGGAISYPSRPDAWMVVILFYVLLGIIINVILGNRPFVSIATNYKNS